MVWTTPKKIALTVALAVICWALFGCDGSPKSGVRVEPTAYGDTDVASLKKDYKYYNERFFNGKLPEDTTFSTELGDANMADSNCLGDNGTACEIRFNLRYTRAQRVAEGTLLHEMCHIKVWSKHLDGDKPPMIGQREWDHNGSWQACMLSLDAMGAFREINIDFYREK